MKYVKKIKPIQAQLKTLPKLYRSHVWITPPASDGLAFIGISQYAKRYFSRISMLNLQEFPKTTYGIDNREYLKAYVQSNKARRNQGQLLLSQKIEWERFELKQGQAFAMLQTFQFDVQLDAPVDMRVVQIEFNTQYYADTLSLPYFFRADILSPEQLTTLSNQQQYESSRKIMMF